MTDPERKASNRRADVQRILVTSLAACKNHRIHRAGVDRQGRVLVTNVSAAPLKQAWVPLNHCN